jgi:hypothetical protein
MADPLHRCQVGLLEHVVGICPACAEAAQAELHDPPQSFPIPSKNLPQRLDIALSQALDQLLTAVSHRVHETVHVL